MYVKIPKNTIDRIEIVKTDCKLSLKEVVATYKYRGRICDYGINGGLYNMKTGKPNAIPLRIDGKTVATSKDGYWMMAWNDGPDICMIHSNDIEKWEYAVACGTMLKDGKETIFNPDKATSGIRGRTGFGDDATNVHLHVTTDTNGPLSPEALRSKMKSNKALNAIMLDGGGSSQMYALGKYYQAEKRKVSYWILIWLKKTETEDDGDDDYEACPYSEPKTLIKQGSRGNGVKWVQWHLRHTVQKNLVVDGIFGNNTKLAVLDFQKKAFPKDKKQWDGIVGAATRGKMKEMV